MTDEQREIQARDPDAAPTQPIGTGDASPSIGLRRTVAEAFSWTRLGVVLAIAILLSAAAYIARPLSNGADPTAGNGPGAVASQRAPASVESSAEASPLGSTRPVETPRLTASIELISSCLEEGFDYPAAYVLFEISWHGTVPLQYIKPGVDGVAASLFGSPVEKSGSIKHGEYVVVAAPHVETVTFYEDIGTVRPGPVALEIRTSFNVSPESSCYPG